MATYSKHVLSGTPADGRNVKVAATATAGTLIHTAIAGTSDLDEIWLYACNTSAADLKMTIEYGGVASPDDLTEVTIATEAGWVLVCPGLLLQNGLIVRAFDATGNVTMINGYVNRITA
jgi:hypothetical protein